MSSGAVIGFTGVLVDAQYKPGQKYIQLVFETAEGMRLSLSRNMRMVRAMDVGLTYQVKGTELSVGRKSYIHEPSAVLVEPATQPAKKYNVGVIVAAILIFAAIPGGAIYMSQLQASNNHVDTKAVGAQESYVPVTSPEPTKELATTEAAPSNSTPNAAAPSTASTPTSRSATAKKSTTTPAVNAPQPPSSSPNVPAVVPVSDPAPQEPVYVPPAEPPVEEIPPVEPPVIEPPVEESIPEEPGDTL